MNTTRWLLAALIPVAAVAACLDWSLDPSTFPAPVDCSLYPNAAARYPGQCGLDAGPDAAADADADPGDAAPPD